MADITTQAIKLKGGSSNDVTMAEGNVRIHQHDSNNYLTYIDFLRASAHANPTARIHVTEPAATHTSRMEFYTSDASGSVPNLRRGMYIDQNLLAYFDGTIQTAGNATFGGDVTVESEHLILKDGSPELYFHTTGSHVNWLVAAQESTNACLEFSAIAAATSLDTDASNYSPVLKLFQSGNATFAGDVTMSTGLYPDANDGAELGNASLGFSAGHMGELHIDDYIYHKGDTDTYIYFTDNTQTFRTGGSDRFSVSGDVKVLGTTDFHIPTGRKLCLDGGGTTYLTESSDGVIDFYGDGVQLFTTKQNGTQSEVVVNEGSGDVDFRVESNNSTHAFFVEAAGAGKVGIGTAVPPFQKLTVTGVSGAADGALENGILALTTGTGVVADTRLLFGIVDDDYAWIQPADYGVAYRDLILNPNGGNIGIGVTDPDSKLEIKGTAGGSLLTFKTTDASSNETFFIQDGGRTGVRYWPFSIGIPSGTSVATNAKFQVEEAGLLTVLTNGNVGIGTVTPSSLLNVGTSSNTEITIGDASANAQGRLRFLTSNNQKNFQIGFNYNIAGGLEFTRSTAVGNSTFTTPDIAITNAGNVGIGTVAPTFLLHVVGDQDILKIEGSGASGPQLRTYDSSTASDGDIFGMIDMAFKDSGGNETIGNRIKSVVNDVTNGTEDTSLEFYTLNDANSTKALTLDYLQNATFAGTVNTAGDVTITNGSFTSTQSSATNPVARFTDAGVANYDWTFPDSSTIQLNPATSSTKTFKLHNSGSGDFNLEASGDVTLAATKKLLLDGSSGHTYLTELSADRLGLYAGGVLMLDLGENGNSSYIDMHAHTVSIHSSQAGMYPTFQIKNTNADANPPRISLIKDSASPADNDDIARIYAYGDNDAGEQMESWLVRNQMTDVSDGAEASKTTFYQYSGGTQYETLILDGYNAKFNNFLGIGTTPATTVHVYGSAPVIRIQDGGDKASNASGYLEFYDHDSLMMNVGVDDGGGAGINLVNNNHFTLKTNNSVAWQSKNNQTTYFHNSIYLSSSGVGVLSWTSGAGNSVGNAMVIGGESGYGISFRGGGSERATMSSTGDWTFSGDIQAPGIYVGSTNTSYDFYNNGTSYLNAAVIIDDNLTLNEYIYHQGDTDTYLRFETNNVVLAAGLAGYIQLESDGDIQIVPEYTTDNAVHYIELGRVAGSNNGSSTGDNPVHVTVLGGYSVDYSSGTRLANEGFLMFHSGGGWTGNQRHWALTNAYDMGGTGGPKFGLLLGNANTVEPTLGSNGALGTNTQVATYWKNDLHMVHGGAATFNMGSGVATMTSTTSPLLVLNPTANNYGGIQFQYGGAVKGMSMYNSGMMVYGGESGVFTRLQAGGAYGLHIDATNQNVHVGSTSDTSYKLGVNGTFYASGDATFGGKVAVGGASQVANSAVLDVNIDQTNGALAAANTVHFGKHGANTDGQISGITLGYKENGNASYRKLAIVAAGRGDGAARQNLHLLVNTQNGSNSASLADSALKLDGLTRDATFAGNVSLADSKYVYWGGSNDFYIGHDTTNTIMVNSTGNLNISNYADNADIVFQSDDGAGGVRTYFFLDGSLAADGGLCYTTFPDNSVACWGNSEDLKISHQSDNTYIENGTGVLNINNNASSSNMVLKTTNAMSFFAGGSTQSHKVLQLNANGSAAFSGSLSKDSGSFKIDHPLEAKKDTHHLVHSFIEGPQADLIYRGKATLVDGTATVNIDTAAGMTEGTFVALNTDVQCFTSNESDWDAVKGSVSGNTLTITCKNSSSTATISWMVVGERQDQHMKDTDWTDSDGKVIVEPEKPQYNPDGSLK